MDMLFGSLSFGNPELLKKIFIFNPHCYKSSPTTKKRNDKNTSGFRQRHHAKKKKKKKSALIEANVFTRTAQE